MRGLLNYTRDRMALRVRRRLIDSLRLRAWHALLH